MSHHIEFSNKVPIEIINGHEANPWDEKEAFPSLYVSAGFYPAITIAFKDIPWSGGVPRMDPYDAKKEDTGLRKLEGYKPSEAINIILDAFVRVDFGIVHPQARKALATLFQGLISVSMWAAKNGNEGEWHELSF